MKTVSQLYGAEAGKDIYVVGTGSSLRVFPKDFFKDKIVIGLNMAWKMVDCKYSVTIHPDLNIPTCLGGEEEAGRNITWVVGYIKAKKLLTESQFKQAKEKYYFFWYDKKQNSQPRNEPSDSGRVKEWINNPEEDYLYVWSSIAQTGVHLAANLGAKNIFLVGCDNCPLEGNHHAHDQHTRWKGVDPMHRYRQYYEGIAEVRNELLKSGVNVFSLSTLLGYFDPNVQFRELCEVLGVPGYISNKDMKVKNNVLLRAFLKVRKKVTGFKYKK